MLRDTQDVAKCSYMKNSFEIRIYRKTGKTKIRTALLSKPDQVGLWAWVKLYFTLKSYTVKQ